MKSETKGMAVNGGGAAVVTYLAGLAAMKWKVPLEVAAVVVGTVFTFIGRWAAKLLPSARK